MPDTLNVNEGTPNGDDSPNSGGTPTFKIGEREYDQDSVVKKIENADQFIEQQKRELEEARQEVARLQSEADKAAKLDEVLDHLKRNGSNNQDDNTNRSTDEELLNSLRDTIKADREQEEAQRRRDEAERIRKETLAETQRKLVERFGNEGVDEAIVKSGLTVETAIRMASDPDLSGVLLRTVIGKPQEPQSGPEGGNSTNRGSGDEANNLPDLRKTAGRKRTETFRELVAFYNQPEQLEKLREKADY
jgi:hypothetical protein